METRSNVTVVSTVFCDRILTLAGIVLHYNIIICYKIYLQQEIVFLVVLVCLLAALLKKL